MSCRACLPEVLGTADVPHFSAISERKECFTFKTRCRLSSFEYRLDLLLQNTLPPKFHVSIMRILINFTLFFIANAASRVDDLQSTGEASGRDSLMAVALDPIQNSNFLPLDYTVAPNDVASLDEENVGSDDFPNLDFSTLTGDSISIATSDSNHCAGNLGRRQDSGFTLGNNIPPTPLTTAVFFASLELITEMIQPKPVQPVLPTLSPTQDPTSKPNPNPTLYWSFPKKLGNAFRTSVAGKSSLFVETAQFSYVANMQSGSIGICIKCFWLM